MFLDGLFVYFLELFPVLAIQDDGIAIIELCLRHWCLDQLVQNVLAMNLGIGQMKNGVVFLFLSQFLEGATLDVRVVN